MAQTLEYARVSTSDQDLSGQKERLAKSGASLILRTVISRAAFDRLGLAALLNYARPVDTLTVINLGRLGQLLRELLEMNDQLKERNINLISLAEQIDINSTAGELVLHVLGAIAHFERRLIFQRTRDGLSAA